jgi:hypothetical protein
VRASGAPSASGLALSTVIPDVKFSSTPLADALDMLSDLSGANLNVDWKTLEAAGISRQTPVTATLHGVPMRKVLSLILAQAAGADTLTFYLEDNVIQITTRDDADKHLVTVVYDVEDLVGLDDTLNPTLPSVTVSGGGGGGGGGGGSSAISGASSNSGTTGTAADRAGKLIKLIENAVRPEIWKDNGGGPSTIEFFDGKLIVTAPRSVQEAIGGYLD